MTNDYEQVTLSVGDALSLRASLTTLLGFILKISNAEKAKLPKIYPHSPLKYNLDKIFK